MEPIPLALAIISIVLTVVAIVIASLIYSKEKVQIKQLGESSIVTQKIASKTAQIAGEMQLRSRVKANVERFFSTKDATTRKYTCVFPVFFQSTPLPSIVAGDYHALQILVNLFGEGHLRLYGIMKGESVDPKKMTEDAIYICTPFANAALQAKFKYLEITDDADLSSADFDSLGLPCWFAEDTRSNNRYKGEPVKKIVVSTGGRPREIDSPAEDHYEAAAKLDNHVRYVPDGEHQRDLAIITRMTDKKTGNKTVIIAGIHQYGTWIAADFFNRLCRNESISYNKVLTGQEDFAAIVWGTFNTDRLRVVETDVSENYIWTNVDGKWSQIPLSERGT